ncbi:type II secretion system F family protein, partial [Kitasatospora sp. NPDC002543]
MNVVHRLGFVLCVVAALGWVVHEVAVRRRERALLRRLNALLEGVAEKPAGRGVDVRGAVGRWGPSMGAMCAGYVLVGGAAGLGLGLVAAFGVWRWRRRARAAADVASSSEAAHAQALRQLPLA